MAGRTCNVPEQVRQADREARREQAEAGEVLASERVVVGGPVELVDQNERHNDTVDGRGLAENNAGQRKDCEPPGARIHEQT